MSLAWLRSPMPLLGKELAEQAARKRTYVLRCAYAALLFIAFCVVFYGEAREVRSGFELLGRGRGMFVALVYIQFVGVLAFLPATMSGVITQEKEQRSLELLLLTDLRPSEILLQKYLGHLIPIFTFLLLSLPLLAICYAFGGVSPEYLSLQR